jgi:cytidyltransferase-like protein
MAIAIVNGKFDLIHVGHFNILMYCRRLVGFDGKVIAAIDTDERIEQIEGKPPLYKVQQRADQLYALKLIDQPLVNQVTYFSTDEDLRRIIKISKSDFLVKGSEWRGKPIIGGDLVQVHHYKSDSIDGINKISSSSIIKTILERYGKQGV